MKKLLTLFLIFFLPGMAMANQSPTASQVATNCSPWNKNLNCSMNNQQLVDNAIDQLSTSSQGINWGNIGGLITNQTDLQTEFGTKQNTITTGTILQYLRGDLSLATFPTNLNQFTNGPGYITGNQNITLSGAVIGSGTTAITTALAAISVQGSNINWPSISAAINSSAMNWPNIIVPNSSINWAGLTTINGTGVNWQAFYPTSNPFNYITGNQTITISGDISGSGTTAITATLPNVNSNTGSFTNANITVNAKGQITAAANGSPGGVTSVTATLPLTSSGGSTPVIALPANSNLLANVGIGSISPGQALDVNGTVRSLANSVRGGTSSQFQKADGSLDSTSYYAASNPNNYIATVSANSPLGGSGTPGSPLTFTNPGYISSILPITLASPNIGIGSTAPGQTIDVQGTVRDIGENITGLTASQIVGTDSNKNLQTLNTGTYPSFTELSYVKGVTSAIQTQINAKGVGSVTSIGVSSPNSTITVGSTPVTTSGTITADINLTNPNTWTGQQIFNTKNVGIGSTFPGQALDVNGTTRMTGFNLNLAPLVNGYILVSNNVGIGTWMNPRTLPAGGGSGTVNSGVTGQVSYYSSSTNASSGSSAIFISGASLGNNIGIGSAVPGALLDVPGTVRFTGVANGVGTLLIPTGNVGIGSATPGQLLDVKGTIRSSLGYVTNGNVGIGTSNPIMPLDVVGTLQPFVVLVNGNVGIGTWSPNASLQIGTGTNSCTSGNNCFGGNVGIGSVAPGLALDVNGTVRMSLGNTLSVVSGTNGCAGQATLSGGVITVSTTCTPNTSIGIFLTDAETSLTNVGSVCIATVTAGSSFVIQSTNASDASKVNWEIHKTT